MREKKTDPYGHISWAVGSDDDFVCFDYYVERRTKRVLLHAVVNSETGHFVQDFIKPTWVAFATAPEAARDMVNSGVEWCIENGVRFNKRTYSARKFAREVAKAVQSYCPDVWGPSDEDEISSMEQAIEDGQARWAETGTSRRR